MIITQPCDHPAVFLNCHMICTQSHDSPNTTCTLSHDYHTWSHDLPRTPGCLLLVAENYSSVEAILDQPHLPSTLCYQAKCGSSADNWTNDTSFDTPFSDFDW